VALGPLREPSEHFVIDTSSFIAIREIVPVEVRPQVFRGLRLTVEEGELVYPNEVFEELSPHVRAPDQIFEFVRDNKQRATRFSYRVDELREVMRHPIACQVVDFDKAVGPDEADPHVLALALAIKKQYPNVIVVTEETRDRPGRVSMTTACGALRLVRLPLRAFLIDRKVWSG